jgi:hypothetical protein
METAIKEKEETTIPEQKKGKRKWGSLIYNFLAAGGFLLVLVVAVVIIIVISILTK